MQKWINHPHISIIEKNLQKFRSKKKHLLNLMTLTLTNDFFIISKRFFDVTVVVANH